MTPCASHNQPTVGDSHAVGVARQIGQHRLGPAERTLGVDDPLGLVQRREMSCDGLRIGETGVVAEEAEAAGRMGGRERREEQSSEQAGEHAHGEEEARPAGHPMPAVG